MAKQENKKIRNLNEPFELDIGDIVKIVNHGKMLCYAASLDSYTFLGRKSKYEIHELEVAREDLSLVRQEDGNYLRLNALLSRKIFSNNNSVREVYESKDDLLKRSHL